MRRDEIALEPGAPGLGAALTVLRFGIAGARPKVYIQAGLHADEIPGLLVTHTLRRWLGDYEAAGRIQGEIVLVPAANPLGLAQRVLGNAVGRFDLADGSNFNRHFPDVVAATADRVAGRLGADPLQNVAAVRAAIAEVLAEHAATAVSATARWKAQLLALAADADLVLDLHCDGEAVMHLYTLTPHAARLMPLAQLLGAEALLFALDSGDAPFDEANSRPWATLAERFPDHPIPLACVAATVELRGQADVTAEYAAADAEALIAFLTREGAIAGPAPRLPEAQCAPTALDAALPLIAPAAGVIVRHVALGARVRAGDLVFELVDPVADRVTPVEAGTDGVLFAGTAGRFALPGQRLGKIAGTVPVRSGKLLSP